MANLKSAGGKLSNPNTYSYAWTVDGTQIANASGVGKKAIIVASSAGGSTNTMSIFDAKDNSLWMKFTACGSTYSNICIFRGVGPSVVTAKDGVIYASARSGKPVLPTAPGYSACWKMGWRM